ncbi:hypothetical protein ACIPSE_34385 [Streptomyces sp. NPDC090106]|uniref:hypothetical protein n=1 Tax=Streptomyces sp. NPDC090106 TaxID=3365946 RepID=UPI0037FE6CD4
MLIAAIALIPAFWTAFVDGDDEESGRSSQQGAVASASSDAAGDSTRSDSPIPSSTPPVVDNPASTTSQPDQPDQPDQQAVADPTDVDVPGQEEGAAGAGDTSSDRASGPLRVTIDMGDGGKIGVATYKRGSTPGANTEVYDQAGRIDTGCYVQWTLTRGTTVVHTHRSGRCRPPGITLFNFGDSLDEVGSYRLTADVSTDWGKQATASVDFDVVAGD